MRGTIIGDVAGSIYEFNNIKTKEFELIPEKSFATDDTVMAAAIADAFLEAEKLAGDERHVCDLPDAVLSRLFLEKMLSFGRAHPYESYGGAFRKWLEARYPKPYYSSGNGSAMRVAPVAYVARSLEECERLAKLTAEITHNHPDGICGAQATAGAVWLAANGGSKYEIRDYVSKFYYWDFSLDELRPEYTFDHWASICEGTVPVAVQAFLESSSFEDAIRNAVSMGGDSDTLAAITGAIAEPFYGIPASIWSDARRQTKLSEMDDVLGTFDKFYNDFVNFVP